MPTSWASLTLGGALAVAVAGGEAWIVGVIALLAVLIEVVFDLAAAFSGVRSER